MSEIVCSYCRINLHPRLKLSIVCLLNFRLFLPVHEHLRPSNSSDGELADLSVLPIDFLCYCLRVSIYTLLINLLFFQISQPMVLSGVVGQSLLTSLDLCKLFSYWSAKNVCPTKLICYW